MGGKDYSTDAKASEKLYEQEDIDGMRDDFKDLISFMEMAKTKIPSDHAMHPKLDTYIASMKDFTDEEIDMITKVAMEVGQEDLQMVIIEAGGLTEDLEEPE